MTHSPHLMVVISLNCPESCNGVEQCPLSASRSSARINQGLSMPHGRWWPRARAALSVGLGTVTDVADEPDRSGKPHRGRTRAEHEALLVGKLTPSALRFTLAFAGLFQLTHGLLKSAILEKVHRYYWRGFDASGDLYDDASYRRDVLDPSRSGGKTDAFRGSTVWLVKNEVITDDEAARLEAIYAHRHDLTHELAKYLIDVDANPDLDLFVEALAILHKIQTYWTRLDLAGGAYDPESDTWDDDVDPDDATPLSLYLLQLCVQAMLPEESSPTEPEP